MKAADINLQEALEFSPDQGILKFGPQRMVIMTAHSLFQLSALIMDIGGTETARVFMPRFGEAAGRDDAKLLKEQLSPDTDVDWLAMGPTIHAWEGLVKPTVDVLEMDREADKFFLQGKWENSFFAEEYVKKFGLAKEAVCWILSGYATGYCSVVFGKPLICKETMCVAKGDPYCQFTVKSKEEWMADW